MALVRAAVLDGRGDAPQGEGGRGRRTASLEATGGPARRHPVDGSGSRAAGPACRSASRRRWARRSPPPPAPPEPGTSGGIPRRPRLSSPRGIGRVVAKSHPGDRGVGDGRRLHRPARRCQTPSPAPTSSTSSAHPRRSPRSPPGPSERSSPMAGSRCPRPVGPVRGSSLRPAPRRGPGWTAPPRASRPRGSTPPWSESRPTSTTWRRPARSSRSWCTPPTAGPNRVTSSSTTSRRSRPASSARRATTWPRARAPARSRGGHPVGVLRRSAGLRPGAPAGHRPLRAVRGRRGPSRRPDGGRTLQRLIAHTRFGDTPIRDVRRCGPPAGRRRGLTPPPRTPLARASIDERRPDDGRPRRGARGCPPRPRIPTSATSPGHRYASAIPCCRIGENVPLVTSPISWSPRKTG